VWSSWKVPGYPTKPTPPFGNFGGRSDTDALWRARDEDRAEAKERFGKLEDGVSELRSDVGEVKISVNGILETEQKRTASAEKRNERVWKLFTAFLVALLVPAVIALFKVFAPIAISGNSVKPPTAIEQIDQMHQQINGGH